jgi:hypothetical protein
MWDASSAMDSVSVDGDSPHRSGFWFRLTIKFVIAYAVIAFAYWEEVRFKASGVRVEGRVVEMFEVGRRDATGLQIKYEFRDPETGARRINSAHVSTSLRPTSDQVEVDYIPGEYYHSRLAVEARPSARWVFFGLNTVIGTAVAVTLGYLIWEANHKPLTRQQRAVAEYRREKARAVR